MKYSTEKMFNHNKMILVNAEQQNLTTITTQVNDSNTSASLNFNYLSTEKSEDKPTNQAKNILYIPEKVKEKLEQTLSQNPPNFSVKNQTDYFIYIIHLLYDIPAKNRNIDLSNSNGFVPVYKQLLKKKVDEYPKYLNYLVENDIVEKGRNHRAGFNSSELRVNPILVSNIIPIEINKKTLIKSINKFHDVSRYYKPKEVNTDTTLVSDTTTSTNNINYPYLDMHFNDKLKINTEQVYKFLELFEAEEIEKIMKFKTKATINKKIIKLINKINVFKYQIEYLNQGNFYNKVDDNVGRYNSILTNIKSELRNYIDYDNQRLFSIDVVSSQPFLTISLLDIELFEQNKMEQRIRKYWKQNNVSKRQVYNNNHINNNQSQINIIMIRNYIKENQNTKDVLEYKNLILTGNFYEKFAEYILAEYPDIKFKNNDSRKYAKMALLKTIYADEKIEKYGEYIPIFKKHFPTVYKLFNLIKDNGNQHHLLACIMQNLEAETLLDKTCGELSINYPDIILYTIHDSIITTKQYIEPVKDALSRNLFNVVDEYPNFKVECWEKKGNS